MAYFIAPTSIGMGDLIVCLPAVQALINSGKEAYLISRTAVQQKLASRIEGLSGVIPEDQFMAKHIAGSDIFYNLPDHPLQRNYWWGSSLFDYYYPDFKINDILKIICKDFGIDVNFEQLKPLQFNSIQTTREKIVFVPGSDGPYKCWPTQYWLDLASWFKRKHKEVVMLGEPEKSEAVQDLLPHLNWLPTPEITDAIDLISSAKAVVAVDTGLMHLAVHQGIFTIALYLSYPVFERKYEHTFSLTARTCDARCVLASIEESAKMLTSMNKFRYRKWSCFADKGLSCMKTVLPEKVIGIINTNPDLFL